MYSEAIEALLEMGEYLGPLNAFLCESATRIQGVLKCSPEEADRILKELRDHGGIDFEVTPGGVPLTPTAIPLARWYWYVRPAA
jgi:hypothetical protein